MNTVTLPPVTITVDYEELDGSPVEGIQNRVFTATRVLKCAWGDRLTLAAQLQGTVTNDGSTITIVLPQTYPARDDATVAEVRIKPFGRVGQGATTQEASYPHAQLTVGYSSPTANSAVGVGGNDDPDGAVVEESIEPFAEFLTLPGDTLYWADGSPLSDQESPGLLQRGFNWVYRKKGMNYVPTATLDLVGKVNDAVITARSLGLMFAAETLLYNPPQLQRSLTARGATPGWDLEYRFTYRPTGWNKFYNVRTGNYENIFGPSATGPTDYRKPYTPGDFLALVR